MLYHPSLFFKDDGRVDGLMMSLYQMDHFRLSLQDLFQSYVPPVPSHMYSVKFVPVLEADERYFKEIFGILSSGFKYFWEILNTDNHRLCGIIRNINFVKSPKRRNF